MASRREIYFAFPDGVLDYECSECDSRCCRGNSLGADVGPELEQVLRLYPALAHAAVERTGGSVVILTLPEGCVFLGRDRSCGLEKEQGRQAKPVDCRDFPFNRTVMVGETRAIRPNYLCPLKMAVPPRPGAVMGTHALLLEQLSESESSLAFVNRHGLSDTESADDLLAQETGLRNSCQEALGKESFADVLRRCPGGETDAGDFLLRARKLLGLDGVELLPEETTNDILLTLAPSLSIQMLGLPFAGRIRTLAIGEVLLRRFFMLNPAALTLQSADHLLTQIGPALRLLARNAVPIFDEEAGGKGAFPVPVFRNADLMLAFALAARFTREGKGTLDALEMAISEDMPVLDRSALLVQLGQRVERNEGKLRERTIPREGGSCKGGAFS